MRRLAGYTATGAACHALVLTVLAVGGDLLRSGVVGAAGAALAYLAVGLVGGVWWGGRPRGAGGGRVALGGVGIVLVVGLPLLVAAVVGQSVGETSVDARVRMLPLMAAAIALAGYLTGVLFRAGPGWRGVFILVMPLYLLVAAMSATRFGFAIAAVVTLGWLMWCVLVTTGSGAGGGAAGAEAEVEVEVEVEGGGESEGRGEVDQRPAITGGVRGARGGVALGLPTMVGVMLGASALGDLRVPDPESGSFLDLRARGGISTLSWALREDGSPAAAALRAEVRLAYPHRITPYATPWQRIDQPIFLDRGMRFSDPEKGLAMEFSRERMMYRVSAAESGVVLGWMGTGDPPSRGRGRGGGGRGGRGGRGPLQGFGLLAQGAEQAGERGDAGEEGGVRASENSGSGSAIGEEGADGDALRTQGDPFSAVPVVAEDLSEGADEGEVEINSAEGAWLYDSDREAVFERFAPEGEQLLGPVEVFPNFRAALTDRALHLFPDEATGGGDLLDSWAALELPGPARDLERVDIVEVSDGFVVGVLMGARSAQGIGAPELHVYRVGGLVRTPVFDLPPPAVREVATEPLPYGRSDAHRLRRFMISPLADRIDRLAHAAITASDPRGATLSEALTAGIPRGGTLVVALLLSLVSGLVVGWRAGARGLAGSVRPIWAGLGFAGGLAGLAAFYLMGPVPEDSEA